MAAHATALLAAGSSGRMGIPKQLVLLHGQPLCRYAALAILRGGDVTDKYTVVVPPGAVGRDIAAVLADLPFTAVVHPKPEQGLLSSFQVAAQALSETLDTLTFALADMPFVTPSTYRALREAFRRTGAPLIGTRYGAATHAVQAPPLLLHARLLPELLELPAADTGPRALIERYRHQATFIDRPDDELTDVDTPDILARLHSLPRRGEH
ncbi:NTP transferase domain-containing protein [Deinococcus sp. HMF7604]|uniref:nucleotidyltransferase family protein n=1 Tax=Deinococcus betulae TaxID=2873312 RepID=UPI001CCD3E5A|nr:NTP transferase domain-containing protein [Deinococcus betulae]MBZ9753357.1 NTP transferase domain-containing protein [Deinococcus betulae]